MGQFAVFVERQDLVTNAHQMDEPVTGMFAVPQVTSIIPARIPTSGATVILEGSSLGREADVLMSDVDGLTFLPLERDTHQSEGVISFHFPPGTRAGIKLKVELHGQASNVVEYVAYSPPEITNVTPQLLNTDGSSVVTITGKNLASGVIGAPDSTVSFGGVSCTPQILSSNRIECTAPPGVDTTPTKVTVSHFNSTLSGTSKTGIAYVSPSVSSIRGSGCKFDVGSPLYIYDCPLGGTELTLVGKDFGSDVSSVVQPIMSVTVGSMNCTDLSLDSPNEPQTLTCTLPSGFGTRDLTIGRGQGYNTYQAAVSYTGPKIDTNSLHLEGFGVSWPVRNNSGTTDGGDRLIMTGDFSNPHSGSFKVIYGHPRPSSADCNGTREDGFYECEIESAADVSDTSLACVTTPGVGKELSFHVCLTDVEGFSISRISTDVFSYPDPVIYNRTLRASAEGIGSTNLFSVTNRGENVYFNGANFGTNNTAATLRVTYGPRENPGKFSCDVDYEFSSDTTIKCSTATGTGEGLAFQVLTGSVDNPQAAVGHDLYHYPNLPVVDSVSTTSSGCVSGSNFVEDCRTDAMEVSSEMLACRRQGYSESECLNLGISASEPEPVILTIRGDLFGERDPVVRIGTETCTNAIVDTSQKSLTCHLPPGTGTNLPVVVRANNRESEPVFLVSYAVPVVYKVLGCDGHITSLNTDPITCERIGGQPLTITGDNFGPSSAVVLIGGLLCANLRHGDVAPHSKLTCNTPEGSETGLTIRIVQEGGQQVQLEDFLISYRQCSAGFYSDGDVDCSPCEPGRFSLYSGQRQCVPCGSGSIAPNEGSHACEPCSRGRYSVNETYCEDCGEGFYQPNTGESKCVPCDPGSYSSTTAAHGCTACEQGRYQNETAQSKCELCEPGRAMNGMGALSCQACSLGTATASKGSYSCTGCPVGKIPDSSSRFCENCPAGRFADRRGSLSCTSCPRGRAAPKDGSSSCSLCSPGTFNPIEKQATCQNAVSGSFVDYSGALSPRLCDRGSYAPVNTSTKCRLCEPGRYQSLEGQSDCFDCEVGHFMDEYGQSFCIPCRVGTYANDTGFTSCDECKAGYSTISQTQKNVGCEVCRAGFFSSSPGQSTCSPCPKGSHTGTAGQSKCTVCPPGQFQDRTAATICKNCAAGTVNPSNSAMECSKCPPGHYQPDEAKMSCIACTAGRYAASSGSTICTACELGKSAPFSASTTCSECASGWYANETASPSCSPCPAGTYALLNGKLLLCAFGFL